MLPNEQRSEADQSVVYRIRIQGHLSQQRMDWFDGLTILLEEDGNTLLTGPVVDQAALHGLLKKVRDLGMPLILVDRVKTDPSDALDVDEYSERGIRRQLPTLRKWVKKANPR